MASSETPNPDESKIALGVLTSESTTPQAQNKNKTEMATSKTPDAGGSDPARIQAKIEGVLASEDTLLSSAIISRRENYRSLNDSVIVTGNGTLLLPYPEDVLKSARGKSTSGPRSTLCVYIPRIGEPKLALNIGQITAEAKHNLAPLHIPLSRLRQDPQYVHVTSKSREETQAVFPSLENVTASSIHAIQLQLEHGWLIYACNSRNRVKLTDKHPALKNNFDYVDKLLGTARNSHPGLRHLHRRGQG